MQWSVTWYNATQEFFEFFFLWKKKTGWRGKGEDPISWKYTYLQQITILQMVRGAGGGGGRGWEGRRLGTQCYISNHSL